MIEFRGQPEILALFVLRTRDGAGVDRRFLRKYTRTRVAFLGNRHLVVTRIDLNKKPSGWIEVPPVPQTLAGE